MHLNSLLLIEKYGAEYFKPGLKILEIGPDTHPSTIQKKFGTGLLWHTIDIFKDDRLTYSAETEYKFPIVSGEYDIVISVNVIEHVKRIWKWVPELARVTKKGGYVITVNPVSWGYHEDPVDCWRIYPEGMKALYDDAGINMVHSTSESLESLYLYKKPYNKFKMWPGGTMTKNSIMQRLKLALGYPVTVATDTITIGQKS